jgi:hypothetical protein
MDPRDPYSVGPEVEPWPAWLRLVGWAALAAVVVMALRCEPRVEIPPADVFTLAPPRSR